MRTCYSNICVSILWKKIEDVALAVMPWSKSHSWAKMHFPKTFGIFAQVPYSCYILYVIKLLPVNAANYVLYC